MKMKVIWFCLRKTVSGSYLKQNNGDLVFQTRTIFWKWVSSSRDQNVIFKIMRYLSLNANFTLKLQGKCWKDDVVTFTAHLSVTIKRLTRYKQNRLQNSPYFFVVKYARAVKQKVWNEAENRERDWGERSCQQKFDSLMTFLNPLVGTNSLHALRACEARAPRAR